MKGHEPFVIGSGERACLLVHGVAGSPAQMHVLAEHLAKEELVARGILLPGHGTCPEALEGVVWQDWYEHLHDEYSMLRREYSEVYLIGFSIGAALSAHYAAHNHVDRLILLNVPLCPLNDRFPTGLMLRIYGMFFREVRGNPETMIDADGEPFCYVYERVPTAILQTMRELVGIAKSSLHKIRVPVLIMQSSNDNVSGGKSGPLAYRRVRSAEKRLVMLERSGHSIMMDVEKGRVFKEAIAFLNGRLS